MTQYEIIDAVGTYQGLAQSGLMNYFAILSSYLVVAYFAGASLSRHQVVIITGLYLVMQLFTTWGIFTFFIATRTLAETITAGGWQPPPIKPIYIAGPLLVFGIIAGLKFMWDVRHPKTD
jgi:hypothetical protein